MSSLTLAALPLPLALPPPPPHLPSTVVSTFLVKGAKQVRPGTRSVCPPGLSLRVLGDLGAAIPPSVQAFLEKSRQVQNMVTFAQVHFAPPRLSLFSKGSTITSYTLQ